MNVRLCPICHEPVPPRAENAAFPFCRERCRLIDLGKWLGGDYRVPDRGASADADADAEADPEE